MRFLIVMHVLVLMLCCSAFSQDNGQGSLNIDLGAVARKFDSSMLKGTPPSVATQAAYDSAYISLMHFMIRQQARTEEVLAWQTTSSRIIFAVVLLIVFTGLVFSGIQFYHSAKSKFNTPASELEMSVKGLKLHSSVLGLMILAMSVAFFYLYLHYVYPVSFIK
ncbi:MAG TPA: hypothetical protein VLC98_02760 [Phnomibacter sp.]|nr:hypothetical protein [Phnomibacter sp.]